VNTWLQAEVTLTLLDKRQISMIFDEFPERTIKVGEIISMVAEGLGRSRSEVHLVRTFPTLRPVHSMLYVVASNGV
jgi:hypothetical protein